MAGYGNDHNNTHVTYAVWFERVCERLFRQGLLNWYANDETHSGLYVDTRAQYNWFNNSVKGEGLQGESYKSKG